MEMINRLKQLEENFAATTDPNSAKYKVTIAIRDIISAVAEQPELSAIHRSLVSVYAAILIGQEDVMADLAIIGIAGISAIQDYNKEFLKQTAFDDSFVN